MHKPTTQYDIAIIGGGLAGLCLSIQAAKAGHTVVLFEKEAYPFHKVCGEYISLESWDFLVRLGLNLPERNLPIIQQLQVSDAQGKLYDFDLPLGGFGISRYQLDAALFRLAQAAGVTVFTETKVQDVVWLLDHFLITTHLGNCTATVAAGSFGKRSNLDVKWKRNFIQQKAAKLNNYIGIKYHIKYPHPANLIALHNFKNGYCGISQVEDGICCLCYLTTAANLAAHNNDIVTMEKALLSQNPQLQKILSNAEFIYKAPLAIAQISFLPKTQVENHLLFVGDAAGMITPLCGNGMSMAMHGSKLAFGQIQLFLQHSISRKQMEQIYTQRWNQQFGKRLQMGRWVQRFFGSNSTTRLFFSILHRFPFLAKRVMQATHGQSF